MDLIDIEFKKSGAGMTAIYNKLKSKGVTIAMIKKYFNEQLPEFKKVKKFGGYNPIQVSRPFELWEIDLMDMSKNPDNGYYYVMNVIDDFTKKVWSKPLKTKTQAEIEKNFLDIVKEAKRTPMKLMSDQEPAITSNEFKMFMDDNNIEWLNLQKSAPTVERFNRTLRGRMERLWKVNGNKKWVGLLDNIVDDYNDSFHRTIKTSPNSVKGSKIKTVENTLSDRARNITAYNEFLNNVEDFEINDVVRYVIDGAFRKGSSQKYTTETFIITEKLGNSYFVLSNGMKKHASKLMLVEKGEKAEREERPRTERVDYRALAGN